MKSCSKCVMDETDSQIKFDKNGICHHCHNYKRKIDVLNNLDKNSLTNIITKVKNSSKKSKYDCVIGLSGGVDSTYLAHYVVNHMNLNPLVVHFDNGWNSELAVKNIEQTIKILKLDLITYVVDWDEFVDIQKSFVLSSTPDLEIPTDHAIFSILRQTAKKHKIKYILNGINSRTESHHPLEWSQGHSDYGYIKNVHKIYGSKKIKTYPHGNFFTIFQDRFSENWINLLDYIDFDKKSAKSVISNELGWKDYGHKHFESIYTRFYQGYILPKKFNIDKRKMHLSSLICNNEITRSEALKELEKPTYALEIQKQDYNYFLKKMKFSNDDFEKIMNLSPKNYYNYNSYYGNILKSKYYKTIKLIFKFFLKKQNEV